MGFVLSPTIKFKATYADGCPLVGGKVFTYLAGTNTPAATYVSEDGAANTNPVILNAKGEADVWLDPTIAYKIEVQDSDGNVITPPVDNIKVGPTGLSIAILDTIGDLRNYSGTATLIYVKGYTEPNDTCGGWFYWNPDINTADDAVIYFQQNSAPIVGRFVRVYDGVNISIRYAGDPGNLDNSYETITRLVNIGYGEMVFPPGEYKLGGTDEVLLTNASTYRMEPGASFTTVDDASLEISGGFTACNFRIFNGTMAVSFTGDQTTNPYWFGASLTNTGAENVTAMAAWVAAGAGVFVLPAGAWPYTGSFPTLTTPQMFYGTLNGGNQGISFNSPGSTASFDNYRLSETNAIISGDGDTGGKIDNNWTVEGTLDVAGNIDGAADLTVSGNIQGDNIAASSSIESSGSITAGTEVIAEAGSSGQQYKMAGARQVVIGTGDCTVQSASLVGSAGSYIKIMFAGTSTNTTPTVTVTVGGLTVYSKAFSVNAGTNNYYGEVLVFRTGSNTSYSTGFAVVNSAGVELNTLSDSRTAAINWLADNTISHSVSATNTKQLTMYEVYPL